MLSSFKSDNIWGDGVGLGLDASALIPLELGGTMQPVKPVVSVMDLGKMLLHCSREGETAKVRELMSRGAPFTTDWLGTTPLHVAASNNHYDTCEVLLRAGVSKNARTKVDRTPLHFAVYEGHEQIVELLLTNKCEVDAQDMLKMTPLHWSVERKYRKIVDLLLAHGADPCVKSKFDKTPMSLAIDTDQPDVFQELISYKMKMVDPEQQQAADSLVYELNRTRSADDQPPLDIMQTDDSSSSAAIAATATASCPSPKPSSCYSSGTSNNMSNDASDSMNVSSGLEDTITKLQTDSTSKSVHNSTLQILKDHGIAMLDDTDNTLLNSALQSGRKLVLSDAGRLILNDPKFKKIMPIVHTTQPPPPPLISTQSITATVSHSGGVIPPNTIKLDQFRKHKPIMMPVTANAGLLTSSTANGKTMPLKTNKVIKILSAEEFKQMCGTNVGANSMKKISTESFQNGQVKYQPFSNANILTQLSRTKKPMLNKIKLGSISASATKPTILSEIKLTGMKPIGHLQKLLPTSTHHSQYTEPDADLLSRVSFSPSSLHHLQQLSTPTSVSMKHSPNAKHLYPSTATASCSSSGGGGAASSSLSPQRSVSYVTTSNSGQSRLQLQSSGGAAAPLQSPPPPHQQPMGLSEIERQLLELKKQTDELRKQLELSQKQNEEYKVRLERLEQEKDRDDRCRQYTNS